MLQGSATALERADCTQTSMVTRRYYILDAYPCKISGHIHPPATPKVAPPLPKLPSQIRPLQMFDRRVLTSPTPSSSNVGTSSTFDRPQRIPGSAATPLGPSAGERPKPSPSSS
jgi:hypothetical protein